MENLTDDKKSISCKNNCAVCPRKIADGKAKVQTKPILKGSAMMLLALSTFLSSCITSDRIVNPSVRHTGTANEPGTRIQPYPRADYEYNDQVFRDRQTDFSND